MTDVIELSGDDPPADGQWRESRDTPLSDAEIEAGLALGLTIDPDDDDDDGAQILAAWAGTPG